MPRRNARRTPKSHRRPFIEVERDLSTQELARDLVRRGLASPAILGHAIGRPDRPTDAPVQDGLAA